MLLSTSLILIVGMSMGGDMQKNKASEFAWNVAYRNAAGAIRFKFAG